MIAPCIFPGCHGGDDNKPILTALGTCEDCRPRFRRLITDIVLDYVNLKRNLPRPAPKSKAGRGSPSRAGYGHPAEWASDTAAEIKTVLFWLADDLTDLLEAEPQLWLHADETAVVRVSHRFLTANFVTLAGSPLAAHAADELMELHRTVRAGMGYTRNGEKLEAPCPACDVAALVRRPPARPRSRKPGLEIRADAPPIRCANCGHEIDASEYGPAVDARIAAAASARAVAIDAMLEHYDRQGPPCAAHATCPLRCRTMAHAGQEHLLPQLARSA